MPEPTTPNKSHRSPRKRNSIFFPLLLVCLGVTLLLHTMNILPQSAWGTILSYWPVLFIAGALDSIYRGEGYVGAVIWGGLGIFLLLNNLGMMDNASWTLLFRWWPVLLIAGGLDLIIGRRSIWSALIGLMLGVALLAGIVWISSGMVSSAARTETLDIQYPLDDVETIYANISATAGDLTIKGGAEPGNAVEASISKASNEEVRDSYEVQNRKGYFDLENDGIFILYPAFQGAADKSVWDVYFNEDTSIVMDSTLIAGEQRFNLNKLDLKRFNIRTIFGRTTVVLPRTGKFIGEADIVFGEMMVFVPEGAPVCIYADTGLTSVDLPDGFIRENDDIFSPNADPNESCVAITVTQAIGTLRVAEY